MERIMILNWKFLQQTRLKVPVQISWQASNLLLITHFNQKNKVSFILSKKKDFGGIEG